MEFFLEPKFLGHREKLFFHSGADDDDNFTNDFGVIKPAPGVSDDRLAGHFQKQFVFAHAGAPAGGYEDGNIHIKTRLIVTDQKLNTNGKELLQCRARLFERLVQYDLPAARRGGFHIFTAVINIKNIRALAPAHGF